MPLKPYRDRLPADAEIRAHEARGGWWQFRQRRPLGMEWQYRRLICGVYTVERLTDRPLDEEGDACDWPEVP